MFRDIQLKNDFKTKYDRDQVIPEESEKLNTAVQLNKCQEKVMAAHFGPGY